MAPFDTNAMVTVRQGGRGSWCAARREGTPGVCIGEGSVCVSDGEGVSCRRLVVYQMGAPGVCIGCMGGPVYTNAMVTVRQGGCASDGWTK